MQNFISKFQDHSWSTPIAQDVFARLSRVEDIFALSQKELFLDLRSAESPPVQKKPGLLTLSGSLAHKYFFPIETLKYRDLAVGYPYETTTRFLSSGTTQEDKSVSPFSRDGTKLYEIASCATFLAMLARFYPNPSSVRGLTFIPPATEQPHSSLSQMLSWLSEHFSVTFLSADDWNKMPNDQPLWLFATGLQFGNLIRTGRNGHPLHPDSILIETGGLKGQKIEYNRANFYQDLAQFFSLSTGRIVSEYGMCELSSQGYDFVDPAKPVPMSERTFRFPCWVDLWAAKCANVSEGVLQGALTVWDPLRIDLPWPIRTQDLVTVPHPNEMQFISRVPYAILKGCSLTFEESRDLLPNEANSHPIVGERSIIAYPKFRVAAAADLAQKICDDPEFLSLLKESFYSQTIAKNALEDLRESLPGNLADWENASRNSVNPDAASTWLIVPPKTHPFAVLQPAFLGYIAGLKMYVRATDTASRHVIHRLMQLPDAQITMWDRSYRMEPGSSYLDIGSVLCFGSTSTIQALMKICPVPLTGFGDSICIAVVASDFDRNSVQHLLKDAFSLAQQGCMSVRAVVGAGLTEADAVRLASLLRQESLSYFDTRLPDRLITALDHERLRLSLFTDAHESIAGHRPGEPLFPVYGKTWSQHELSRLPFVLPIMLADASLDRSLIKHVTLRIPAVKRMSLDKNLYRKIAPLCAETGPHIAVVPMGAANIATWDGTHEKTKLFSIPTKRKGL